MSTKNRFEGIQQDYFEKAISKNQFIEKMNDQHQVINEYPFLISKSNIETIEISNEGVVTKTKQGIKLWWNIRDLRAVSSEMLNFSNYEEEETKILFRCISPDDVIFDIGANIGWYSLLIASIYPKAQVFAFEPMPQTYNQLCKNIKLNDLKNIETHKIGFFESEKEISFYFNPNLTVATSIKNILDDENIHTVKGHVVKLDSFTQQNEIKKLDFIKLDVEGAELFVIRGGLETLAQYTPIIFMEMLRKWSAKFGYHPNDLITLIQPLGYQCFKIQDSRIIEIHSIEEDTDETNFFFLHCEKHQSLITQLSKTQKELKIHS